MRADPKVTASYNLLDAYLRAHGRELKGVAPEDLSERLYGRFHETHDPETSAALDAFLTLNGLGCDDLILKAKRHNDRRQHWTEQPILGTPTSMEELKERAVGKTFGNSAVGVAQRLPEDDPNLKQLMNKSVQMPNASPQVLALIDDLAKSYSLRGADLEAVGRFAGVDVSSTFIPSASTWQNVERMLAWAWAAKIPKGFVRTLRQELIAEPSRQALDDATREALAEMRWTDPGVQNVVRRLAAGYAGNTEALEEVFKRHNGNPAHVNWHTTPLNLAATTLTLASRVKGRIVPFVEEALAKMPAKEGARRLPA